MGEIYGVGIDLGTTFSCVAVCRNGIVQTCHNDIGKNTTPSRVCFVDNKRIVGESAQMHYEGVIYDVKRLIGRSVDDESVKRNCKNWMFDVIKENEHLKIKIKIGDIYRSFYPEDISAAVLSEMKKYAENYTKKNVGRAVITVPAYFNDAQRRATMIAGNLAGLEVLKIINEPTAAAYTYGFIKNDNTERHILVFDLGGGTFDVSILKLFNTKVIILAVAGNNYLGGIDFDSTLLEHCIAEFQRQTEIDLRNASNARRSVERLRYLCERAKITLSSATEADIDAESLYEEHDYRTKISRSRFESLNRDLFDKTMGIVDGCIKDSKLDVVACNLEIVLVGGSTRIPKIQELLAEKFSNLKINTSLNRDEAVAHGAAIFANILMKSKKINKDYLADVIPLSLGVASKDGIMSVIIPRNTKIPTKISKVYSTVIDNQESMMIKVYEGERFFAEENNLLGEFELSDIPNGERGHIKIKVTFKIDYNGILTVSAVETTTKTEKILKIANDRSRLSDEEIALIVKQSEVYKVDDERRKEAVDAKNLLLRYLRDMKIQLRDDENLTLTQIEDFSTRCDNAIEWSESHVCLSKRDFEEKRIELEYEYRKLF